MPGRGAFFFQATNAGDSDGYQFEQPIRVYEAVLLDEVPGVIAAVQAEAEGGCFAAGYIAYEAGSAFERTAPRRAIHLPYAWFGIYEARQHVTRKQIAQRASGQPAVVSDVRFSIPRSRYRKQIDAIRALIYEGDVYQINYTGQLRFNLEGSPEALFVDLVGRQAVPYAAYVDTGEFQILSLSPELFFRRENDHVVTRPMKGTAIRGRTRHEDDEIERELAADEKNRAENLMIVDLVRNDLSRCCRPGSVHVPALFETERYETLIQMSSQVEGELIPGTGLVDVIRALFPCGSVTGAPKIRAMQRIDRLEDEPRGVYCGAIGFVEPGGAGSIFNVAIRTAVIQRGVGRLGIGSGVVWDSDADQEYDECLLKARFFTRAGLAEPHPFFLIETMRADDGDILLLELHLDRLSASAEYFGLPIDPKETRKCIDDAVKTGGRRKIRLTLADDGTIDVTSALLDTAVELYCDYDLATGSRLASLCEAAAESEDRANREEASIRHVQRGVVSAKRIDSQDPMRLHKTSSRKLYTTEFQAARDRGYEEVVFFNERDQLCEGSRSNVFVRNGHTWRTPRIESGVLPGVYRRHLIETVPNVSEETLYIRDIVEADAVYFCNAVRGLIRAEIVWDGEARLLGGKGVDVRTEHARADT